MSDLHWLDFEYSEGDDGTGTFDAMASVEPCHVAQVRAEIDLVLAWAESTFAGGCGPVEDGGEWEADLQAWDEPGEPPRHCITLTLAGSPGFCEAFRRQFG